MMAGDGILILEMYNMSFKLMRVRMRPFTCHIQPQTWKPRQPEHPLDTRFVQMFPQHLDVTRIDLADSKRIRAEQTTPEIRVSSMFRQSCECVSKDQSIERCREGVVGMIMLPVQMMHEVCQANHLAIYGLCERASAAAAPSTSNCKHHVALNQHRHSFT
jgi:hypothetical protein